MYVDTYIYISHASIHIYNLTRLGLVGLANVSCKGSFRCTRQSPLRAAAKALKAKGLLNHQGRLKLPKPQGAGATRLLRNSLDSKFKILLTTDFKFLTIFQRVQTISKHVDSNADSVPRLTKKASIIKTGTGPEVF